MECDIIHNWIKGKADTKEFCIYFFLMLIVPFIEHNMVRSPTCGVEGVNIQLFVYIHYVQLQYRIIAG